MSHCLTWHLAARAHYIIVREEGGKGIGAKGGNILEKVSLGHRPSAKHFNSLIENTIREKLKRIVKFSFTLLIFLLFLQVQN